MDIRDRPSPATSVGGEPMVIRLLAQLRLLVQVLVIGAGTPEAATMVAGLRQTTTQAAGMLAVTAPDAFTAITAGLAHADAGEFSQARTELLAASRSLRGLTRRGLPGQAEPAPGASE